MRTTCGYSPSFVEGYKRGYYIRKISTLLPKNRPFSGSLPLAVPSNPSVNPPAKGNITYLQFLPFGMSPCACGWSKKTSNIFSCDPAILIGKVGPGRTIFSEFVDGQKIFLD